jgi:hypothetical protein
VKPPLDRTAAGWHAIRDIIRRFESIAVNPHADRADG